MIGPAVGSTKSTQITATQPIAIQPTGALHFPRFQGPGLEVVAAPAQQDRRHVRDVQTDDGDRRRGGVRGGVPQ